MGGFLAAGIGQGLEKGVAKVDAYDREQHRRQNIAQQMDMQNQQLQSNLQTQSQQRQQSSGKYAAYEQALSRQGEALQRMNQRYIKGEVTSGTRKFAATGDVTHINNVLKDPQISKMFGVNRVSQPNREDPTIINQAKKAISEAKAKQLETGGKEVMGPPTAEGEQPSEQSFLMVTPKEVQNYLNNPLIVQDDKGNLLNMQEVIISTGSFDGMTERERKNFDYQVSGLKDPGGGEPAKAQSAFGKFRADMIGAGVAEKDIPGMYSEMEKNPDYGQAMTNLKKRGLSPSQENIDNEVRAIKGTSKTDSSSGKATASSAYDKMIGTLDKMGVDFNNPDKALDSLESKSPIEKGRAKASAKEFFKESGEKLMPPETLGKHLKTLTDVDASPAALAESVASASGLGDVAANTVKQFFSTDEGIEFSRVFKQTFNNLLTTGSKGHISQAELDNLTDAFGGLSGANEVVFNNFKSMLQTMKSQVDAYKVTSPVAAEVLYGKEMKAYDTVMSALDSVDTSGMKQPGSTVASQYNFQGD